MKRKSESEMQRYLNVKKARTLIRLKHSCEADIEANEVIPTLLAEFNNALAAGEILQLEAEVIDLLGGADETGQ